MMRHQYVILSQAVSGREAEFEQWYDRQHLQDVCAVEGVVSARRFKIDSQRSSELDVPAWSSLAIYEIEGDDPQSVIADIAAAYGGAEMSCTDTLSLTDLIEIVAHEVAAVE